MPLEPLLNRIFALTLLLMSQQMGFSLELLAALIAGRQALSLHCINIVVERQVVHEGVGDYLGSLASWV